MILRLDHLNGSKFFNLASPPRLLNASSVEAISGIEELEMTLVATCSFVDQEGLWRDKLHTRSIQASRVCCDLSGFGVLLHLEATNVGLIIGH